MNTPDIVSLPERLLRRAENTYNFRDLAGLEADLREAAAALASPAGEGRLAGFTQFHLDNWTDDDFKQHIPAVREALQNAIHRPAQPKFFDDLAVHCQQSGCQYLKPLPEQPGSSVQGEALADAIRNIPVPTRGFHEGWRDEEIWQWALNEAAKLVATPPPAPAAEQGDALAAFTDYFVRNYPGPDTVIMDPRWHASRIFRAAQYAISTATQPEARGVEGKRIGCGDHDHAGYIPGCGKCAATLPGKRKNAAPNPVRAEQPEGKRAQGWWCPNCRTPVDPAAVTFDERHDERNGGCGISLAAAPAAPGAAVGVDGCEERCQRLHPHCTLTLTRSLAPDYFWHWAVTMPDGHLYDCNGGMTFEQALSEMNKRGVVALDAADSIWRAALAGKAGA